MSKLKGRSQILITVLAVVFLASAFSGFAMKKSRQSDHPVLGKDPLSEIKVMEDHKHALAHWFSKGIKDAILVNVDGHDDLKKISDKKIDDLKKILVLSRQNPGDLSLLEKTPLLTSGNFIYAAAKLGMVREVYWVIPPIFFGQKDSMAQLASMLRFHRFSDSEIDSFRQVKGCFKGQVEDIELNICSTETLPRFHEPILLSIDVDFAPAMAKTQAEQISESVMRTLTGLTKKKYRIMDTIIAYSVQEGHLDTFHRWAGDLVVDVLKAPHRYSAGTMPENYQVLQRADQLRMMGRHDESLPFLLPELQKDINDPAVLTYLAYALHGMGSKEKSRNAAEYACRSDKRYCSVLSELGIKSLYEDGLETAEKYFDKAYAHNPEMARSQFILAQAYKKAERYDDAIRLYTLFRNHYGSFPVDFYLGETYLLQGNEDMALRYFNSGRVELVSDLHLWAGFGDTGVVRKAVSLYEEKGYNEYAKALKFTLMVKDEKYSNGPQYMRAH